MNWYQPFKIAQIWQVNYDNTSMSSMLSALYEVTYKFQTLKKQPFKGLEVRQNNILSNLESSARNIISDIVNILQPVFENWLKNHALNDPISWADAQMRMSEDQNEEYWGNLFNNYGIDSMQGAIKTDSIDVAENVEEAINSKKAPFLTAIFLREKSDLKELNEENNQEADKDLEDRYIDEMTFSEFFSQYYESSWVTFLEYISNNGYNIHQAIRETCAFGLFPIWYGYWRTAGIDYTRNNVQKAHDMLYNVLNQPIEQALATINIVINTSHQTGEMLDYITEVTSDSKSEIYRTMTYYSNMQPRDYKAWDMDLQEVGSQYQNNNQQINNEQKTQNELV